MAQAKVVYEQTIEGIFVRGCSAAMTPRCKERLREVGVDLDRKLLPAYPFDVWMAALVVAADELYPSCPPEEAQFKLGERMMHGFNETFLGRAVLSVLRVLGPVRATHRTSQHFRAGNNYTETQVRELGPGHMELWMNEVGPLPHFTRGILQAGLAATGAKDCAVEVADYDGHGCTYKLTWVP